MITTLHNYNKRRQPEYSGFTMQGAGDKLYELRIFKGIEESKCQLGNEEFHDYIKKLVKAN